MALIAGRKGRPARPFVIAASLVTLLVFLIPHSLLGSEYDYTKPDLSIKTPHSSVSLSSGVFPLRANRSGPICFVLGDSQYLRVQLHPSGLASGDRLDS